MRNQKDNFVDREKRFHLVSAYERLKLMKSVQYYQGKHADY